MLERRGRLPVKWQHTERGERREREREGEREREREYRRLLDNHSEEEMNGMNLKEAMLKQLCSYGLEVVTR